MSELQNLGEKFLEAEEKYDKNRRKNDARYARNAAFAEFTKAWYDKYEISLSNFRAAREAAVEIGCEK